MADLNEPKGFAFGDLNPVSEPRTAKRFDSKHTSALGAMREVVVGHFTPDALASTGPYKGVVLRVEEDMDQNNPAPGNWLSTVFGPQGMFGGLFTVPKKLKQYKVRIPELHSTLPIPDKFASSPTEVGTHQKIIDMYPTFVAKDSNVAQASHGDLVWVDFGHKGNMDDPTFLGPVFPPPEAGGGAGAGAGGGASDAFNCSGGALGGGGMGAAPSGGSLTPEQRAQSTHSTMSKVPGHQQPGNTHSLKNTQNPETHWYFNPDTEPTPSDWDIKNFTPKDCQSAGDKICAQNKDTLRRLDMCASRAKEMGHPPIQLTNMVQSHRNGGYRDPAFNKKKGGSKKSRHQFGDGYDIWTKGWTKEQRINILYNLYAAGFRGFGHGINNIHADTGKKRQWDYNNYGKVPWKEFDGRHLPTPAEVKKEEEAPPAEETPAETPPPASSSGAAPQITAENITKEQALAVALTDEEKAEVNAATGSAAIAATVAGKRAIEQSKNKQATPAQESTSAQPSNSTPQQSQPPQNNCTSGGGGGGSGGRGAQNIAHLSKGESIGGVDFIGTTAADPFTKMGLVKVAMDKIPSDSKGKPWYVSTAKVREDVAPNVTEVKRILNELGCVMPSSGSSRNMNASVGPGRIATSFHYTSAALDLLLPVMMSKLDVDNWLVEFDPDRQGKFIVWARSGFTSGSVSKGGQTFQVEHKTLQAIYAKGGKPPEIRPTTAYVVNVTKLMWAHGLKDIGARSSWYKNSTGASEAWHFDFRENMGLVKGKTRFEEVLLTIHDRSNDPPWASGHKTWSGGSFSDIKLKTSITYIGRSPAGIPKYTFIYRNDKTKTRYHGVMAQDILKINPSAVRLDSSGFYKVNYDLIDVDFHTV